MTTSTAGLPSRLGFSCFIGPTGMPRPSSITQQDPSAWMETRILGRGEALAPKAFPDFEVTVDGEPVTQVGTKVVPQDQRVEVDGFVLRPEKAQRRYYLLNKPPGVLCTNEVREVRPRAMVRALKTNATGSSVVAAEYFDADGKLHLLRAKATMEAKGETDRIMAFDVVSPLDTSVPDVTPTGINFGPVVPTPTVSVVDFTAELEKDASAEELNAAFQAAAEGPMKGILGIEFQKLVSMDFKADERSSIIDADSTMSLGGNFVKVLAWYDNEWGYSCRVADLVKYMGERL